MSEGLKLQPLGQAHPEPFMSAAQYWEFTERLQNEVKAELDKQREARIQSEEQAKLHLIG